MAKTKCLHIRVTQEQLKRWKEEAKKRLESDLTRFVTDAIEAAIGAKCPHCDGTGTVICNMCEGDGVL